MTYLAAYVTLAMIAYGAVTIVVLWGGRGVAKPANAFTVPTCEPVFPPKLGFWLLEVAAVFLLATSAFGMSDRIGRICGSMCAAAVTGSLAVLVHFQWRGRRR